MKLIDENLLNQLSSEASKNERLRINYNLHEALDDGVQRLLNALEPGTVLPIHRHQHQNETYLLLRGKMDVHIYNDEKDLVQTYRLDTKEGQYGLHMPKNTWHSIEVLSSGTVILEVKEGPYQPLNQEDIMEI